MNFFRGMLLNGDPGDFAFFETDCQERRPNFSWGACAIYRNYGLVVILLPFPFNFDNLTLKLHQGKRSYPNERWLFIGRFKVGSVPGKIVVLVTSKKKIKIDLEYDTRSLIK